MTNLATLGNPPLFCLVQFCCGDLILHQKGIGFLMFWYFLEVVYSRACESRGVWIKVRKLKNKEIIYKKA